MAHSRTYQFARHGFCRSTTTILSSLDSLGGSTCGQKEQWQLACCTQRLDEFRNVRLIDVAAVVFQSEHRTVSLVDPAMAAQMQHIEGAIPKQSLTHPLCGACFFDEEV